MIIQVTDLTAFTKDKVELTIIGYCSVKVFDAEKAVFEVGNCKNAIRTFAMSSVRTAVGKMDLQEILDNRAIISSKVEQDMKDDLHDWGFNITKFEISDVNPTDTRVSQSLKLQITAEQDSKEKHINADS